VVTVIVGATPPREGSAKLGTAGMDGRAGKVIDGNPRLGSGRAGVGIAGKAKDGPRSDIEGLEGIDGRAGKETEGRPRLGSGRAGIGIAGSANETPKPENVGAEGIAGMAGKLKDGRPRLGRGSAGIGIAVEVLKITLSPTFPVVVVSRLLTRPPRPQRAALALARSYSCRRGCTEGRRRRYKERSA
jgi:hypothetical protein